VICRLEIAIPWEEIGEDIMSAEAQDLIRKLLHEDPQQRLGAQGADSVKNHPFFAEINWSTLREQKAPFIPAASQLDTTLFEGMLLLSCVLCVLCLVSCVSCLLCVLSLLWC
jgi:serine/threonine protein kinase